MSYGSNSAILRGGGSNQLREQTDPHSGVTQSFTSVRGHLCFHRDSCTTDAYQQSDGTKPCTGVNVGVPGSVVPVRNLLLLNLSYRGWAAVPQMQMGHQAGRCVWGHLRQLPGEGGKGSGSALTCLLYQLVVLSLHKMQQWVGSPTNLFRVIPNDGQTLPLQVQNGLTLLTKHVSQCMEVLTEHWFRCRWSGFCHLGWGGLG